MTDIWIAPESRDLATAMQREVHRQYQREHGLADWVAEVDNQNHVVTFAFLDDFDAAFKDNFQVGSCVAAAVVPRPARAGGTPRAARRGVTLAVARVSRSHASASAGASERATTGPRRGENPACGEFAI